MKQQYDGFLSYSRKDLEVRQRVEHSLKNAELKIWVDEGLQAGDESWKIAIENALNNSRFLVVLLSPAAKASKWVRCEIRIAELLERRIFPVLIDGDELTSVPFGLNEHQLVDLRQPKLTEQDKWLTNAQIKAKFERHFETQIGKLIDDIKMYLREINNENPAPPGELNPNESPELTQPGQLVNQVLENINQETATSQEDIETIEGLPVDPSASLPVNAELTPPDANYPSPYDATIPPAGMSGTGGGATPPPPDASAPIPFSPSSALNSSLLLKLFLTALNIAIVLGVCFYFGGDSFLGYGQLFAAVLISLFGTLVAVLVSQFEKWLDQKASIWGLLVFAFLLLLIALAVTQPWWARLSVRQPVPVRDENDTQIAQLQPGQPPVTLLGVSEDSLSYLIECPHGLKRQQCWVEIDNGKIKRQGIEGPLPEIKSISNINATATAQAAATQSAHAATAAFNTAVAQTAEAATAAFNTAATRTAHAATATQEASVTALLLTITAEGYNTATREAANQILTQTREALDLRATVAAELNQTVEANVSATQAAIAATDAQRTALAVEGTRVVQLITDTAEAASPTPTNTPTNTPTDTPTSTPTPTNTPTPTDTPTPTPTDTPTPTPTNTPTPTPTPSSTPTPSAPAGMLPIILIMEGRAFYVQENVVSNAEFKAFANSLYYSDLKGQPPEQQIPNDEQPYVTASWPAAYLYCTEYLPSILPEAVNINYDMITISQWNEAEKQRILQPIINIAEWLLPDPLDHEQERYPTITLRENGNLERGEYTGTAPGRFVFRCVAWFAVTVSS